MYLSKCMFSWIKLYIIILDIIMTVQCNAIFKYEINSSAKLIGGGAIPRDVLKSVAFVMTKTSFRGGGHQASMCSGTIISVNHLLTAAHCVVPRYGSVAELKVCIGERYFNNCKWERTVKEYFVASTDQTFNHISPDLAVLTLRPGENGRKYSKMRILPSSKSNYIRRGKTFVAGPGGSHYKSLDMEILTTSRCFGVKNTLQSFGNGEICGVASQYGNNFNYNFGIRKGDSGGPLYVAVGKEHFLYGVTSWVITMSYQKRRLGVFANAYIHRKEINKIIKEQNYDIKWKRFRLGRY